MKLIGIGGTNGSGKDTLGEFLAKDYGWLFVSGSNILREELNRRGLPIERENLRALGNEWRKLFGAGVLINKSVEQYRQGKYNGLVLASIRSVGEADRVHELGGKVVWVDAAPKIRYERIYSRRRSTEDDKSYKQFLKEEQDEMFGNNDKATLNMAGVKAKADIFLTNDTNNIDDFKRAAQAVLKI